MRPLIGDESESGPSVQPEGSDLRVFINYRRDDTAGEAGRLHDALRTRLGNGSVFMDVDAIRPGADFAEVINQAVGSSDVLVTVIGRNWLSANNVGGPPRLDDPRDVLRLEIQSALRGKIRVVPVLVQGAQMPRADQLPKSLAKLAGKNAFEISHVRWHQDVERLIASLETRTQQRDELNHNLPYQLTNFVGRSDDITTLKRTLRTARLLTLTGAGGCGKTRLALQAASELVGEYPGGVRLIEFAAVTDPKLVPLVVATTLGIREKAGQDITDSLIARLQGKRSLLILDNCEHLVTAGAALAEALLRACPRLHLLVTSREALNVGGEVVQRVQPLALPYEGDDGGLRAIARSEAVQLFVDRAWSARQDFTLDGTNASAVSQICQRLDGIPLAIELAAARIRMMPPGEILGHLQDRFRLLTAGSRTALPRQQTLRAAVEWSYRLLSESEQIFFNQLSVFAGGFSLDAAEAVCAGDRLDDDRVLDLVGVLVDKSLVVVGEASDGRSRYMLLETLREFGREQLRLSNAADAGGACRQLHADHYLMLAEDAEKGLRGPDEAVWVARLDSDVDNLRSAFEWYAVNDATKMLRLASALGDFWTRGRISEGREAYRRALESFPEPTTLRARALYMTAQLAKWDGDYQHARSSGQEALSIAQSLDNALVTGLALGVLGESCLMERNRTLARSLFEESVQVLRKQGDPWALALSLNGLGLVDVQTGAYDQARRLLDEALEEAQKCGQPSLIEMVLGTLSAASIAQGDVRSAREHLTTGLLLARGHKDHKFVPEFLELAAALAEVSAQPERSLQLLASAEQFYAAVGLTPFDSWRETFKRACSVLAPDSVEAALMTGRNMTMSAAIAIALEASGTSEPNVALVTQQVAI
jgi:predicted ATPase